MEASESDLNKEFLMGHKPPYGYRWDGEMFRVIPEEGAVSKRNL